MTRSDADTSADVARKPELSASRIRERDAHLVKVEELEKAELSLPKLIDWRKLEVICRGSTAWITIIDDKTVLKFSSAQGASRTDLDSVIYYFDTLATERLVYKRLGDHPRICKYHGDVRYGMILERYKACVSMVLRDLAKGETVEASRVLKWSIQLAEALSYIHSKGVIHFDISCNNFLLSEEDDLLLCDFGGSSIDGGDHCGIYDTRYEKLDEPYPEQLSSPELFKWELFALGSAIYEMSTGLKPYRDLTDSEVEKCFEKRIFPDTHTLYMGEVIQKCWHGSYNMALEVTADLRRLQSQDKQKSGIQQVQQWPPLTF